MDKKLTVNVKVEKQKDINIKVIPEKAIKIKADGIKYVKPNFDDATAETDNVLMGKTFYSRGSSKKQTGTLNPQDFATILSISLNGTEIPPDKDKNVNIKITKETVGLDKVDNTSDLEKPVSNSMQKALDNKVNIEEGKGLSTNDFNNNYKINLDELIKMKEDDEFGKVDDIKVNDNSIVTNKIANIKLSDSLEEKSKEIFASTYLTNLLNKNKVEKEEGKQLSTNDFSNEYKNQIDTNATNINTLDTNKANKTDVVFNNFNGTQNITSNIALKGDLNITGNIIQNGSAYETHAEKVYTKNDYIITRDGAVSGLGNGEFTGILAKKYDGNNDGHLVFDNQGIARVGDVGDEQPLATREEIPIENGFANWDNTTKKFITKLISSSDLTDKDSIAYKTDLETYLPLAGGQLTGALKIARGFQKGLLDTDDTDILYIDNNGNLCIGYGLSGKTKLTSNRIDVESNAFYVKHNFYVENGSANFQYNGKSVAVKDDIPKTLNNKTLVANGNTTIYGTDITLSSDNSGNLTDAINGKADTSAIPTKTSQLTNDSDFATTSQIPDTSGFVPNTRTINSKALSSNISLNNKDVGALPDYTINISHQTAGNPRIVKFVSVNYASAATCFKMGAMTCHDNGVSYQFLTDMLIAVTTSGVVTANIYKFAQSGIGNVDGVARYTGDVFYVNDTTNKIVDFYILCGQYSSSQFTPVTKVGSTTIAYVTQYSGTATYYSSGDKTWADGCGTTYARLSDIPTKTSQLTNDSGFATTSQLNDKASISSQNTFAENQNFNEGLSVNSYGIWLANAVPIRDSDGNSILKSDSGTTIVGNTSGNIQLFGAGKRPTYTSKYGNMTNIALYTDIPDVKKLGTTNWTVSQDSSGNLVFKYE